MKYIYGRFGLLLVIFSCLFIVKCSNNSAQREPELQEQPEHIFILDEIPDSIKELENLTVYPGDSEPQYYIELIPEQTFGETGEPYLTTLDDAVVDDQERVFILNANTNTNQEHSIYVYDENGTFHTQLGRHGRGPGEYGWVFGIQENGGKLYVRDITNERITIFNTESYSFKESMLIEQLTIRDIEEVQGMELGPLFIRNDGNHLVNFYPQLSENGLAMNKYLFMDDNGNALESDPLTFPGSVSIRVPSKPRIPSLGLTFMGQSLIALTSEDALYSVWTRDFLLKRYNSIGEYESAIYYPIRGVPFDFNEYAQTAPFGYSAQDIEEGIANADIELPEANPVLDDLMVDDENRIWAAVPMDQEREKFEWWILDESGELLAKLQRPSKKTVFDIKNGHLYAKEIDEETDAEYVVKYRMEWIER